MRIGGTRNYRHPCVSIQARSTSRIESPSKCRPPRTLNLHEVTNASEVCLITLLHGSWTISVEWSRTSILRWLPSRPTNCGGVMALFRTAITCPLARARLGSSEIANRRLGGRWNLERGGKAALSTDDFIWLTGFRESVCPRKWLAEATVWREHMLPADLSSGRRRRLIRHRQNFES